MNYPSILPLLLIETLLYLLPQDTQSILLLAPNWFIEFFTAILAIFHFWNYAFKLLSFILQIQPTIFFPCFQVISFPQRVSFWQWEPKYDFLLRTENFRACRPIQIYSSGIPSRNSGRLTQPISIMFASLHHSNNNDVRQNRQLQLLAMQEPRLFERIETSHYMIDEETLNLVVPGDLITSEEGFMNGHGTYKLANQIRASVMGTVEITNKLIIVNPLRSKYSPQVGDIVVGRVQQIANKRWKIDIRASAYAFLSLNSTYIPQQRKKNEDDEFNMRKIMREGDLIVAEVHSVNNDKTFNLHTRNPKYGRLEPGMLIEVSHRQIKRQKHHMITIGKVGIVFANNGNIYLSNFRRSETTNLKDAVVVHQKYSVEELGEIAFLANILKVLGFEGLEISELLLKQLLEWARSHNIDATTLLQEESELKSALLSLIRERIPSRIEQISSSLKKM